jgi:beta-fructofuranosidase
VEEHRALLWGWAWEGETRGLDEIATAGWAGVLTFPRELGLRDGSLVSRPATELTGLRQEPIAVEPGRPFDAHAFEIEASGPVRLRIAQQGVDAVVAETDGPARIFVDGSLVEVFAETTTITTRAYPGPTSRWLLEAVEATATVWRLRRPDPAPPRTD